MAAFWLLMEGMLAFYWQWGGLRAVLFIGIAALALWSLSGSSTIERSALPAWLGSLVAALLAAHVIFCIARLFHPPHLADIGATTLAAVQSLAQGINPYTANIDHAATEQYGMAFAGYKYLPVMPLVYAPLGLLFAERGVLLTNFLLDLAIAGLVYRLATRNGGRVVGLMACAAYLSLPIVLSLIYAKGVTDLAPVALLLAGMLVGERRPFIAGLLTGLSISSKLMPGIAALPACLPARGRISFLLGFGLGLLPAVLAWASAPNAFVDNIIRFNAVRFPDTSSWMLGVGPGPGAAITATMGVAWLALALFSLRRPAPLTLRCSLVVLLISVVILGGPVMHQNYHLWWIPFLCIALTTRVMQLAPNSRTSTIEASSASVPVTA